MASLCLVSMFLLVAAAIWNTILWARKTRRTNEAVKRYRYLRQRMAEQNSKSITLKGGMRA